MERENGNSQCWPDILLDCSFPNDQFQGTKRLGKTWELLLRLFVILGLWDTLGLPSELTATHPGLLTAAVAI